MGPNLPVPIFLYLLNHSIDIQMFNPSIPDYVFKNRVNITLEVKEIAQSILTEFSSTGYPNFHSIFKDQNLSFWP